MPPVGRFAPTPSGPLHLGSLVAAVASYCHSRSQAGQWLLRIEDVDTPRVVKGAAEQIIRALEQFGFEWDGSITYQSERFDSYQATLSRLRHLGLVYSCECSRRQLRKQAVPQGPLGLIYPGNCRDKQLPLSGLAQRLDTTEAGIISFEDGFYGHLEVNVAQQLGDPVLRRSDSIFAYHLAVVVDDQLEGINQIVRGADLLYTTCIHRYLQQSLGYTAADYYHVPLVNNEAGDKLSKQTGATALDPANATALLLRALHHLGQPVDPALGKAKPGELLKIATENWNDNAIVERARATSTHLVNH